MVKNSQNGNNMKDSDYQIRTMSQIKQAEAVFNTAQ